MQHILPRGKPGLYIWLKQVCEPQGSPEAAEGLSPRWAHGALISGALLLPLCAHSLQLALTDRWDRSIIAATAPKVLGLSLRHPADRTPRSTNGNREFSIAESWSQAAPPVLSSPFSLRMWYTSSESEVLAVSAHSASPSPVLYQFSSPGEGLLKT